MVGAIVRVSQILERVRKYYALVRNTYSSLADAQEDMLYTMDSIIIPTLPTETVVLT